MKLGWVVLTMGDRWPDTRAALESIAQQSPGASIVLVLNGCNAPEVAPLPEQVELLSLATNVGIPAGRAAGIEALGEDVDLVGFLDDDATLCTPATGERLIEAFEGDDAVAAAAMRIVDEHGETARRHVPRVGAEGSKAGGAVVTFLGGACAVRRSSYVEVGGYWNELFYSHEELELSWRLHDAGYTVVYKPDLVVAHPRTEISRHDDGWKRTGRNRVLIARRNLPIPVAAAHTMIWLAAGFARAPGAACKKAYLAGWFGAWRQPVTRSPMRWRTVWRLTRLGRPPII